VAGAFAIFITITIACGVLIYRIAEVPLSRSASRLLQMRKWDARPQRASTILPEHRRVQPQASDLVQLSRDMENCPLGDMRNSPLL
jgi:hypothetical protein